MDDLTPNPGHDWHRDGSRSGGSATSGRPGRILAAPGIEHRRPFAWQQDETLWILDWEADAWVLAELCFDPAACTYRELRRTRYRWQREAAGALLGRIYSAGQQAASEAASHLLGWLHPGPTQA